MTFIIVVIVVFLILIILIPSKGKRGEKLVALNLKRLPEEKYRIINDLLFSCGGHSTQIDHVVVSLYGIFVLETKFHKGWIYGSANSEEWTQNIYGHKYKLYNPIFQNDTHIRRLRVLLKEFGELPFFSIVAFSRQASVRVKTHIPIVYWNQVVSVIKSYDKEVLDSMTVDKIYRKLLVVDDNSAEGKRAHIQSARSAANRRYNGMNRNLYR